MALPKGLNAQRDFSAGQLDQETERRDDTDLFKAGCRTLSNAEIMAAGAATRRAGTRHLYEVENGRVIRVRPATDYEFDIVFRDDEFEAINTADGASQTVTGCPWGDADLDYLSFAVVDRRIFVAAPGMRTQILRFRDDDTWSRGNFSFRDGLDDVARMPFYRFGNRGTRIKVSGTGAVGDTVDIEFDDDVLVAGMVGTVILYGKSQMEILTVTSATTGTAEVLQPLPRVWQVVMKAEFDKDYFRVGDVVEGDVFGAKGQVVGHHATGNAVYVLTFEVDSKFADDEMLIGPNASAKITDSLSGVATEEETVEEFWTTLWEEQFVSNHRGWPGGVAYDRNRLLMYNFDQLPDAFLESAIGDPQDFKIGSTATDAIFERTPSGDRVRHMIGGHDQFVLTDVGIYYIPISTSDPLAPGSVQLVRIGTGGASQTVRPVTTSRGVVYVPDDGRRVMAIRQTGENTRAYVLDDIARFHTELFSEPRALATSPVGQRGVLESLYVINGDGTAAAGAYTTERDWVGFVPWTTDGEFLDVTVFGDGVVFLVRRTLSNDAVVIALESPGPDTLIDGAVPLPATLYGGAEVWLYADGGASIGPLTLEGDGTLPENYADYDGDVGFAYTFEIEPMTENFDPGQSEQQRLHRRKINRWAVSVRDTQEFTVGGIASRASYRADDNLDEPQPLRSETFTGGMLGRSWDPRLTIQQAWPGKITVIEIGMEIM